MVASACSPSIYEAETDEPKFKASLVHTVPRRITALTLCKRLKVPSLIARAGYRLQSLVLEAGRWSA